MTKYVNGLVSYFQDSKSIHRLGDVLCFRSIHFSWIACAAFISVLTIEIYLLTTDQLNYFFGFISQVLWEKACCSIEIGSQKLRKCPTVVVCEHLFTQCNHTLDHVCYSNALIFWTPMFILKEHAEQLKSNKKKENDVVPTQKCSICRVNLLHRREGGIAQW